MSADEFDPDIERLFARSPHLADAPIFAAEVEAKLASGSRVRALALTLAGLVGGAVAVREMVGVNLSFGEHTPAVGRDLQAAGSGASSLIQASLDQLGLANMSLGSMSGIQLFWVAAGALIAVAAAGVMKLSQEA